MKVWHWVVLIGIGGGLLYVLHLYKAHGGVSGVRNGFGMGGYSA